MIISHHVLLIGYPLALSVTQDHNHKLAYHYTFVGT